MIMGSGGFARETYLVYVQMSDKDKVSYPEMIGFLDDDKTKVGSRVKGTDFDIFGRLEDLDYMLRKLGVEYILPSVGSPRLKEEFTERLLKLNYKLPEDPLLHRSAVVGWSTTIGAGSIVCSHSSITCDINIGRQVNINLNCTIGHDAIIGDFCNLSPDVNVSGYVVMGKSIDVGTGAVILPKVTIGDGAIIGAGAVVNKDIPPGETWVGVPARPLARG